MVRFKKPYEEDQSSITQWCEDTFGPATSNKVLVNRAQEEMEELLDNVNVNDNHPKLAEEIADIFIVLYRVADRLGVDIHDKIDEKMKVNRTRKWRRRGDGCGDHIKESQIG